MTIAVNDAGDVLTLDGGAWKPATIAHNDETGARLVLDAGAWKPLPSAKQAEPEPTFNTEYGPAATTNTTEAPQQSQFGADLNALVRAPVASTGAAIAGAGEAVRAAGAQGTARQVAVMDAIDRGDKVPDDQDTIGYQYLSPDQRTKARADFTAADADLSKRGPNALTQAGDAIETGANQMFPVDPSKEGIQTRVAGMVGGMAPVLAAGAVGGPIGAAAVIGGQAYHGTYQEAIAKGATPEQAEDAAGKSAAAQVLTMALPVNRLLTVPVSLREGLAKTLVNLGVNGVEFGSANAVGTFANNYVASQTFDPGRSLTQGTGEAGLEGAIAGLIVPAAMGGLRGAPTVADVVKAPDLNGAISAAERVAGSGSDIPADQGASTANWGQLFGSAHGNSTPTLTLPSGTKVPTRFDVAEAADLTPASGDLQPRDRAGRMASSGQIAQMASNLDPELLHSSPGPDQGAPTINANGVVLAGNGRLAAIKQAYALGNADPYRAMIERQGIDTSGMSNPVLIRRIDQNMTPEQERQFAVESNIPAGQRLSATEQAAIDAQGLTPNLLARYDPLLGGGPTAAGNRDFVRAWVATLPQAERNGIQGANGALSSDGVRRLQGAMLASAYGDKGTLARSLESTDDNARSLTGALTDAAPAWAQLKSDIASGSVSPEMDVSPQLMRAVDLVRQAREKGQSISDVLSQSDAFNPIDPVTDAFVRSFYNANLSRPVARPVAAEILKRYATEAGKAAPDAGLFGDALPAVSPADILGTTAKTVRSMPPPEGPAGPVPNSVGAAASREQTPESQIAPAADEAAAIRHQGEVERLAMPPTQNDTTSYIPGAKPTLAEVTGNPKDAMDQAYNRQQPEAMTQHIAQENHNSEAVADYYADTAGSRPTLQRMETARDAQAASDIKNVFGDPQDTRTPADPTPTIELMHGILDNPRQGERDAVTKTLTKLADKFYNDDGNLKTDPYALYGIGEHINDLLRGAGDTETSSAARVLKRELVQIKNSLYSDIEAAAPGFAEYRNNYQNASRAIDAMKLLQDARLSLLNKDQHITPAKWFSFMRDIVEGRSDPMDPASSLSEDQMDRLWNITDQLKRSTFIDAGKPRGSWTSMMQEWGGRFARLAAHGAAAYTFPVIGNLGVEMGAAGLRKRSVTKEMNRVLNPDLGQQSP